MTLEDILWDLANGVLLFVGCLCHVLLYLLATVCFAGAIVGFCSNTLNGFVIGFVCGLIIIACYLVQQKMFKVGLT